MLGGRTMEKKSIFSAIQATGKLTLGNYLGAIHNWVKLQDEFQCTYSIADLHTLTVRNNPETIRQNIMDLLAVLLAAGVDPNKANIFIQSHVAAHSQMAWVLNCYTYMGELSRMTQFKDKSAKHADNINAGLFTYPVLMAGDILLYKADLVPVGEDQRQHIEITRDIAERFNKLYGETFVIPEPYILGVGARVMGLQNPTSKMSKSSTIPNDSIYLTDTKDEIVKKIKKAVTDSEGIVRYDVENKPGISNLISIYGAIQNKTKEEVEKEFENANYGSFKNAVAEAVVGVIEPLQQKYQEIIKDTTYMEKVYREGAKKAEVIANETMREVYEKIGLVL